MKKIIILFLLTTTMINCHCQDKQKDNKSKKLQNNVMFINNKSLKHSIVIMSCDTCVPVSNNGYRIIVDLTNDEKSKIKKIDCEGWISLLENKKSDWAANLILYDIFDRDAHLLSRRNSRKLWVKFSKEEDIDFWKKKLCTK
jgi:hypothetical protein